MFRQIIYDPIRTDAGGFIIALGLISPKMTRSKRDADYDQQEAEGEAESDDDDDDDEDDLDDS
ncbi:hypothetical protein GZH46_00334, partial [Fragariocoptes setiger]